MSLDICWLTNSAQRLWANPEAVMEDHSLRRFPIPIVFKKTLINRDVSSPIPGQYSFPPSRLTLRGTVAANTVSMCAAKAITGPEGSVPGHSPITLPISSVRSRVNPKDGSCSCTYFARAHSPPIPLESLPTESNPWLLRLRFRCRRQRLHAEHRMGRLGPT